MVNKKQEEKKQRNSKMPKINLNVSVITSTANGQNTHIWLSECMYQSLPDLANENPGYPLKFVFQKNKSVCPMQYLEYTWHWNIIHCLS